MIYTVTARTQAGCTGTDNVSVKVYEGPEIYVPNAFSPNNDGRNDLLKAVPVGLKTFLHFSVFNRVGQRLFYTTNPAMGWDGKVRSGDQNDPIFVWMAEGVDETGNRIARRGTVIIVR